MLEESHSSSAVSCKDYFHLGINPLVAVTDNPAFRLQTNPSFNETRNIGGPVLGGVQESFCGP